MQLQVQPKQAQLKRKKKRASLETMPRTLKTQMLISKKKPRKMMRKWRSSEKKKRRNMI